ncbi:hypothetical protein IHE44_0012699 [Lamprotornis superbus]|uniref:Acrosin n=1 Tax=Lamprotornis superbus TaxID=245042 RepID=A0A835TPM7_9PASS|nr:hypothetical protein IHE44_0012699 [Lamprotornis superbus]
MCAGALIHPQWVLTVARCFFRSRDVSIYKVVIGATDLAEPGPKAAVRHVKRILVHHDYVATTARNDIALLELEQPVECSDYIQLGCVPNSSLAVPELKTCYMAGWRATPGSGTQTRPHETPRASTGTPNMAWFPPSPCPSTAAAHSPSLSQCPSVSVPFPTRVFLSQCPHVPKSHPAPPVPLRCGCDPGVAPDPSLVAQGDLGAPLVCKASVGDYFWLVGLASWGRGCSGPKRPGVFTSTRHFHGWIQAQLGLASAKPARTLKEPALIPSLSPIPSPTLILTAITEDTSPWKVLIGATDLSQPGPGSKHVHITRILMHQDYNTDLKCNDIALLELEQPVECSDYIQLGCVPDSSLTVSLLKTCYMAGWRATPGSGQCPRGLRRGRESQGHSWAGPGQRAKLPRATSGLCPGATGRDREGQGRWGRGLAQGGAGCSMSSVPSVPPARSSGTVLQEAKVRLMDVQLCNSSRWYGGAVHPQDLCAGYPRGGIDTCQVRGTPQPQHVPLCPLSLVALPFPTHGSLSPDPGLPLPTHGSLSQCTHVPKSHPVPPVPPRCGCDPGAAPDPSLLAQGDVGAPLVCKDIIGDYFWLVGLASWGKGCAGDKRPGVFTSTQHFHTWILVQMGLIPRDTEAPPPKPAPPSTLEEEPAEIKPKPVPDVLLRFFVALQEFLVFLKNKID